MTKKHEENDRVRLSAIEHGSEYEYQRIDRVFVAIDDSMIIVIKGQSVISANSRSNPNPPSLSNLTVEIILFTLF